MVLSTAQPSLYVSPTLPLSYKHLSLCVVLAAMCFSQHLARRGREEGRSREKGAFFRQQMTDALLKEPGPFERPAPSRCPHPVRLAHCHGVLAATPPPSQALCHCKSPHRPKQTHSGGKKKQKKQQPPFSTVPAILVWPRPWTKRLSCCHKTYRRHRWA